MATKWPSSWNSNTPTMIARSTGPDACTAHANSARVTMSVSQARPREAGLTSRRAATVAAKSGSGGGSVAGGSRFSTVSMGGPPARG